MNDASPPNRRDEPQSFGRNLLAALGVRRDTDRHVELMRRSRQASQARKLRKLGYDENVDPVVDPLVDPVSGQPLMICHVCGTPLDPDTGNCRCSL